MKLAWNTYDITTLVLIAFLLVAAWIDLRHHRIPNWLTGLLLLSGVLAHGIFLGWMGLLTALGGIVVGLLIFLPFWLGGGMGAGDVKLAAGIGAYTGGLTMVLVAGLSLLTGFFIALGMLTVKGGLKAYWNRNWITTKLMYWTGQVIYQPPSADEPAAQRFPFAIAIATGTIAALGWTSALSFSSLRMLFI
ncbi:MAG: A24 family peptidase [Pseudomonadales bacterium]